MNKDVKKNRYKKQRAKKDAPRLKRVKTVVAATILVPIATAALGCMYIFFYDLITQCDYFAVKEIQVNGLERLSKIAVLKAADIDEANNSLQINLHLVRKKLLAHPWIDTVEVKRIIPDRLEITIVEHHPMAIVDIGDYFLINDRGRIFKKLDATDPRHLPTVTGLELDDITRYHEAKTNYFNPVMDILTLGKESNSGFSNSAIDHITVDRELGLSLTLWADKGKLIKLGFNDYEKKIERMKTVSKSIRKIKHLMEEINVIDLNNLKRVVITPAHT